MEYQVVGPVRVLRPDGVRSISAPKMACILTALLLQANCVVSRDTLIAEMWGENPPRRAVPALHVHVSQLRKLLSTGEQAQSPLRTHVSGYVMEVDPASIDATVIQRLMQQGRISLDQDRAAESARLYEEALSLWRGPVLGDHFRGPIVSGFVTWIQECRLECLEGLVEANLMLGRHRAVIGLLSRLVAEYPLHEAFYGQLMRAMEASGRRADALSVYRKAWNVLDEELGLAPGPRLRELQSSLLRVGRRVPAGQRR